MCLNASYNNLSITFFLLTLKLWTTMLSKIQTISWNRNCQRSHRHLYFSSQRFSSLARGSWKQRKPRFVQPTQLSSFYLRTHTGNTVSYFHCLCTSEINFSIAGKWHFMWVVKYKIILHVFVVDCDIYHWQVVLGLMNGLRHHCLPCLWYAVFYPKHTPVTTVYQHPSSMDRQCHSLLLLELNKHTWL